MKKNNIPTLLGLCAVLVIPSVSAQVFEDFEARDVTTTDGAVMFRQPRFSNTSAKLAETPNFSRVVDALPAGNSSSKALKVSWAFAENVTAPWLRLTTSSAPAVPNPTIDLTKNLRFDIWSDRDVKLALGVRETGTSAEIGANGGAAGTIEWVGVTGVSEGAPLPIRTILANQWTTVYFNVDGELSAGFTGNGSVSSATGKGVLEHLALVPLAGHSGEYNIYLDNFEVTAVPEPSTYAMIFGLAALTGGMYFRKKRAA